MGSYEQFNYDSSIEIFNDYLAVSRSGSEETSSTTTTNQGQDLMNFTDNRRIITPGKLSEKWKLVDDVRGGTPTMREAGRVYMPQDEDESNKVYGDKLKRAVLINKYKAAIETATGLLSANGVTVKDDGEEADIDKEFLNNVDGLGGDLETFVEEINDDQMHYGISYVLVDFPTTTGEITLEEQRDGNIRPYFVKIGPRSIIEINTRLMGAVEVLTYFEYEYKTPDNETTLRKRFSIVAPPGQPDAGVLTWATFKEERTPQGVQMILQESGTITGVDRLPIVAVYGQKVGPWLGEPVLEDLAHYNIAHWQKYAQLSSYEHIATAPMIKVTGLTSTFNAKTGGSEGELKVSPYRIIEFEKDGDAGWLEISGSSLEQGREALRFLEEKMEKEGIELTLGEAGVTATANALSASESIGKLRPIKKSLVSAFNEIFDLYAQYIGADVDYQLEINDNVSNILDDTSFARIEKLHEKQIITDEALLAAVNSTLTIKLELNENRPKPGENENDDEELGPDGQPIVRRPDTLELNGQQNNQQPEGENE